MRLIREYEFPKVVLDPGCGRTVSVAVGVHFRMERLYVVGSMAEIRGAFWIKRSRLPRLDRGEVFAYSTYCKTPGRRRTVVERLDEKRRTVFVRSYLPKSVSYLHIDPLSYVSLTEMSIDAVPAVLPRAELSAAAFGPDVLGASLSFRRAQARITMRLESRCDIRVLVSATAFGCDL